MPSLPQVERLFTLINATMSRFSKCAGIDSYFALKAANQTAAARNFMSARNDSTFATIKFQYDGKDINGAKKFLVALQKLVKKNPPPSKYMARLTGMPKFVVDTIQGMQQDTANMDTIALPLALLVLVYVLKSVRLLVFPLLSLVCSICFSFSSMYFVATKSSLPVVSFAPSMLESLTVAMSVDYSLFILTRFREEVVRLRVPADEEIVCIMLRSSGHTVVVSGCTLAACFFGLCIFPLDLLRSAGLGCAIAILATVSS
jgi:uncharacterized membrane protein YdfJ with MMPL/SSD domain